MQYVRTYSHRGWGIPKKKSKNYKHYKNTLDYRFSNYTRSQRQGARPTVPPPVRDIQDGER